MDAHVVDQQVQQSVAGDAGAGRDQPVPAGRPPERHGGHRERGEHDGEPVVVLPATTPGTVVAAVPAPSRAVHHGAVGERGGRLAGGERDGGERGRRRRIHGVLLVTARRVERPRGPGPVVALDHDAGRVGCDGVGGHHRRHPRRVPDRHHAEDQGDRPVDGFGPACLDGELGEPVPVAARQAALGAAAEQCAQLGHDRLPPPHAQAFPRPPVALPNPDAGEPGVVREAGVRRAGGHVADGRAPGRPHGGVGGDGRDGVHGATHRPRHGTGRPRPRRSAERNARPTNTRSGSGYRRGAAAPNRPARRNSTTICAAYRT